VARSPTAQRACGGSDRCSQSRRSAGSTAGQRQRCGARVGGAREADPGDVRQEHDPDTPRRAPRRRSPVTRDLHDAPGVVGTRRRRAHGARGVCKRGRRVAGPRRVHPSTSLAMWTMPRASWTRCSSRLASCDSTNLRIAFSRSHEQGFTQRSRSLARSQQVLRRRTASALAAETSVPAGSPR
jgi:hypothetical protein